MVPLESLGTISCSYSILVTMALFVSFLRKSKILAENRFFSYPCIRRFRQVNVEIFPYRLVRKTTLCSKKTCDHVFDDKLKQNCLFRKIFGALITKSTGHRQVFLFFHLTYFVQLLYIGKLSRPKYQQKLNKIMKISQEDVILIKNLYLSKQHGARKLLSELPDKGWKL